MCFIEGRGKCASMSSSSCLAAVNSLDAICHNQILLHGSESIFMGHSFRHCDVNCARFTRMWLAMAARGGKDPIGGIRPHVS